MNETNVGVRFYRVTEWWWWGQLGRIILKMPHLGIKDEGGGPALEFRINQRVYVGGKMKSTVGP